MPRKPKAKKEGGTNVRLDASKPDHEATSEDAVIQQALRIIESRLRVHGAALASPQSVRDYLRLRLANSEHEVFVVIFLDAQNNLIACEEMFRGTLTQTAVHPREVVKAALRHNAAAVIFAHFVPGNKMGVMCP